MKENAHESICIKNKSILCRANQSLLLSGKAAKPEADLRETSSSSRQRESRPSSDELIPQRASW
jgi:hypothetical protein